MSRASGSESFVGSSPTLSRRPGRARITERKRGKPSAKTKMCAVQIAQTAPKRRSISAEDGLVHTQEAAGAIPASATGKSLRGSHPDKAQNLRFGKYAVDLKNWGSVAEPSPFTNGVAWVVREGQRLQSHELQPPRRHDKKILPT